MKNSTVLFARLILTLCLGQPAFQAAATELPVGMATHFKSIQAGATDEFQIKLKKYDYFSFKVRPKDAALELRVFDPSGEAIYYEPPFVRVTNISVAADDPGIYRVVLTGSKAVAGFAGGAYQIESFKHWGLSERLNPPEDASAATLASPMVKQLKKSIQSGGRNAIDSFWASIKKRGTPVIEALPGDERQMNVTFFWKGDHETHNAVVMIWPFAIEQQARYKMSRLTAGSEIWFKTLPIPKDARYVYSIAPNVPEPHLDGARDVIAAAMHEDPLNPLGRPRDPAYFSKPSRFQKESILEMPFAQPQPWIKHDPNVPAGKVVDATIRSELLKNTTPLSVYTPAGYLPKGEPASLVILFDQLEYLSFVPTPTILDNLISRKKIRPTVAVLVDFPEPRYDNRSRELTCNPQFSKFLRDELLPWIHKSYHVTSDPAQIVVGGSSFGGLAAACSGFHYPDTFRNILSQSGSFWWTADFIHQELDEDAKPLDPDLELNDVAKMFLKSPKLPLRFYMEAGSKEIDLSGHGGYLLLPGQHLRDILLAKGYPVDWHIFRGGHDYLNWRESLADGLIFLGGTQ